MTLQACFTFTFSEGKELPYPFTINTGDKSVGCRSCSVVAHHEGLSSFDPGSNPGTSTLTLILLKRVIEGLFFTQIIGFKKKVLFSRRIVKVRLIISMTFAKCINKPFNVVFPFFNTISPTLAVSISVFI